MKRGGIASLTLFFLALIVVSVGGVGEERVSHSPISILGHNDLNEANGIVAGCGTSTDPYMIAGWTIDMECGIGIRIQEISAYIVIRDCQFTGDGRWGIGILLRETTHVSVLGCSFSDFKTGLFIYQGANTLVEGNTFAECRRGIEGTEVDGVTITANIIANARERGIFLWRCHEAFLWGNNLSGCDNGIYLDSCHRGNLERNYVKDVDHGIFLWDCFDCIIASNTIQDCGLGLAVIHTSERNLIFGNVFLGNERAATCDEIGNSWDSGYSAGGNFWGGNPVQDRFSGVNQDQPGADGISDNPKKIPFGNVDRYPLMEQSAANENT